MGSVEFDANDMLSKSAVLPASFSIGGWYKVNVNGGYTELASTDGTSYTVSPAASPGDTMEVSINGVMVTTDIADVYDGWFWLGVTHATGSSDYNVYWRMEGQSVLSTDLGTFAGDINSNAIYVGGSPYGDGASNVSCRSYFMKDSVLSANAMLIASSQLTAPTGANQVFLALTTAATAATNSGTIGNFTVSGTLADDPSQPNPSIVASVLFAPSTTLMGGA